MNKLLRVFALGVALWCTPNVEAAPPNLVSYQSSPFDYIGQGATYYTTNAGDFSVSGSITTILVQAFGYYAEFDAPGSSVLAVGLYTNAVRWPFNGSLPGLSISGNGRGCNTLCGEFEILDLHTNAAGQIDSLWLTFTQHCECLPAQLSGEIRFNSHAVILDVEANPNAGGSVGGAGVYEAGSNVVISAEPNPGWRFLQWNDGSTQLVHSVVVPVNGATYTASFRSLAPLDFDGDGFSDIAVYHPASGTWYILQSSNNAGRVQNWGWNPTKPVPGDYDGDGTADIAVYYPALGAWSILQSSNNAVRIQNWGWSEATPVPGDYDGDGQTDIAVYHPALGTWYILQSSDDAWRVQNWGWSEATPVPGDYDGDGKSDIAVYHPAGGTWYILKSSGGSSLQNWGWSEATPVPGDYDGDGKTDIAVYYPAGGTWYILKSSGGGLTQILGWFETAPVPGDYDGDGKVDIAVYHQAAGNWYILKSETGASSFLNYGWSAAVPVK